jgi:hypothetical protein
MSELKLIASTPSETMVYQYGFRPDENCISVIDDQFRKASALYNLVISICRKVAEDARNYVLDFAGLEALALNCQIIGLSESFKEAKSASDKDALKLIAEKRREIWTQLKPMLAETRKKHKDRLANDYYSKIGTTVGTLTYAACTDAIAAGLGADTANSVLKDALKGYQDAMSHGGLPQFKRHSETTKWTLTVAAHRGGGVPISDLKDWKPCKIGKNHQKNQFEVSYRLGAANLKVYATGLLNMHRELPDTGGVAEAVLKKEKVGLHFNYWIQFVLTKVKPVVQSVTGGSCALHMGWESVDDGKLVAAIATTDAPTSPTLIHLPDNVRDALKHSRLADSVRDDLFNASWPKLKELLKAQKVPLEFNNLQVEIDAICKLPLTHIALNRIHYVLDGLQRLQLGPSQILLDWFKKDRALLMRSSAGRRKAQNQREYFYRQIASEYAKKYQTLVITKIDLKKAAEKVNEVTGEKTEFNAKARSGRVDASVSTLKESFIKAFRQAGSVVVEHSGKVTNTCSSCGAESLIDSIKALSQDCTNCGEHFETRKTNAAINLLQVVTSVDNLVDDFKSEGAEKLALAAASKLERLAKMQAANAKKRLESLSCDVSVVVPV